MKKILILAIFVNMVPVFSQKLDSSNAIWDNKTNSWVVFDLKKSQATLYRKDGSKYANGKAIVAEHLPDGRPSGFIMTGKWKSWYPDGKLLENLVYNEKGFLHGNQVGYHKNGKILYRAYAENGFYHGKILVFDDKGKICGEQDWDHGNLISLNNSEIIYEDIQRPKIIPVDARYDRENKGWVFHDEDTEDFRGWYNNGEKMFLGKMSKDKIQYGKITEWYKNGNISKEGECVEGKPDGHWKIYSEDGKLSFEEIYRNGELIDRIFPDAPKRAPNIPVSALWIEDEKIWTYNRGGFNVWYYPDGIKKAEGRMLSQGKLDGLWNYWLNNGKRQATILFKNGEADGETICYDENEKPILKIIYKDGKKIKEEPIK
jgi:antitoxin component YwqK of YwqJK toxin-antitoxin module